MKMMFKFSFTLSPSLLLLLLLLFSVEFSLTKAAVIGGARAVRIPEHTCHKQVDLAPCTQQNCTRECSKEQYGFGVCRDTVCFCTFYCKDPPV